MKRRQREECSVATDHLLYFRFAGTPSPVGGIKYGVGQSEHGREAADDNRCTIGVIPPQLDLRFPQGAAENPFFREYYDIEQAGWTPGQK